MTRPTLIVAGTTYPYKTQQALAAATVFHYLREHSRFFFSLKKYLSSPRSDFIPWFLAVLLVKSKQYERKQNPGLLALRNGTHVWTTASSGG